MKMTRINPLQRRARFAGSGFTLIEMMLAMTITVMVMTGVLTLFQLSGRVARNQIQLADLPPDAISIVQIAPREPGWSKSRPISPTASGTRQSKRSEA